MKWTGMYITQPNLYYMAVTQFTNWKYPNHRNHHNKNCSRSLASRALIAASRSWISSRLTSWLDSQPVVIYIAPVICSMYKRRLHRAVYTLSISEQCISAIISAQVRARPGIVLHDNKLQHTASTVSNDFASQHDFFHTRCPYKRFPAIARSWRRLVNDTTRGWKKSSPTPIKARQAAPSR